MTYVRGIVRAPASSGADVQLGEILSQQLLQTAAKRNPSTPAPRAPGSDARTYQQWANSVRASSGVTLVYQDRAAARYAAATLVPRVNAHQWSLPDAWTKNGQYGYYFAPDVVDADSQHLKEATPEEIAKGARELEEQWWKGPLKAIGFTVAGGIVLAALTRKLL